MFIIESISAYGVKTSPARFGRMETPHPGDVIDFGDNIGNFPYTEGRYGRVEEVGTDNPEVGWVNAGELHVCCGNASVFLHEDGSCSISGGPFAVIKIKDLEPTNELKTVLFWNWGDHSPGADQGVNYHLARPVFRLKNLQNGGNVNND